MSDLKINFLKKRRAISEKEYLRERKLFVISLTGFLGLFVVMLVLFGLQFFNLWQIKKTKAKLDKAESKLAGLKEVSARQLYLRSRLDIVKDFLNSRVKSREAIEKIFSLDIPGVVVANVTFVDEQDIMASLEANSVIALSRAFEWFKESNFFIQVVNKGVSKLVNGSYTAQLILTIPREGTGQ